MGTLYGQLGVILPQLHRWHKTNNILIFSSMNALKGSLPISILIGLLLLLSCEKDENNVEDDVLQFSGYINRDIIFYVGGEPADPSQLDMSKLLDFPEESWISLERYRGDYYRFNGDSVDLYHSHSNSIQRFGYYFENDSLFLVRFDPWLQTEIAGYDAVGSESRLERKHCLVYARKMRENGTFESGGGFNVNDYYTIEDLQQNITPFQDLSEMGPNDTLIFYNQTQLFE